MEKWRNDPVSGFTLNKRTGFPTNFDFCGLNFIIGGNKAIATMVYCITFHTTLRNSSSTKSKSILEKFAYDLIF